MTTVVNRPSNSSSTTVQQTFLATGDAVTALAERTTQVDHLVIEAAADLCLLANPAVLAVGGYGRRQLFPFSDVDLLLLFASDREVENSKKMLAPFLQRLWDSG